MRDDTREMIRAYATEHLAEAEELPQVRFSSRLKHLAKEGHVPGDITVEITCSMGTLPPNGVVEELLLHSYQEALDAAKRMNDGDAPLPPGEAPF